MPRSLVICRLDLPVNTGTKSVCCMNVAMTDTNLISKFLHPGDRIRIGRNRTCELVIPCPNLSGLHCAVEVKKTSGSPRPSSFNDSDPTKCTVLDLSSNGTWLIKCEEAVARPTKLKKGVMVDLCPGDCIMLLAPQHKLCMQHRFVLQCNSAAKGEPGSAEFVLVQLPWEGDDSSTVAAEKLPKNLKRPSGSGKVDSKSSDCMTIASTKDGPSTRKRKSSCEPADGELDTSNLKKSRLEATSSLSDHVGIFNVAMEVNRKLKTGDDEVCSSKMLKSPKLIDKEVPSRTSVEKVANFAENLIPNITSATPIPSLTREVSKERCPTCLNLFPIVELPTHCAICQRTADSNTSCEENTSYGEEEESDTPDGTATLLKVESTATGVSSIPVLLKEISLEQCPSCSKLFPVLELMAHAEVCILDSSRRSVDINEAGIGMRVDVTVSKPPKSRESDAEGVVIKPVATSTHSTLAPPSMPTVEVSMEECPNCLKLFPLCELVEHCEVCRSRGKTVREEEEKAPGPMDADNSNKYNLESYSDFATAMMVSGNGTSEKKKPNSVSSQVGAATCGTSYSGELEQCLYCLKDFPVPELIYHVEICPAKDRSKSMVEEHCQHCLKVFPLDELVTHALNCSQRKTLGSLESEVGDGVLGSQDVWGEPVERCMFCFKDFPLSVLVEHSRKCTGDMLGSLKRFQSFLPSVHDLDAMALTVLTDTQMSAMEYVLRKSKEASERVYPYLLKKVLRLGFTETDLERTLQWVRQDAPIIIHVNLDRALRFLVDDTHYRNLFEVGTGGGSTDFSARKSWEDRIFNRVYKRSPPMERVKYGVLNIVGDPRGVRCCYGYGDSFLQLKKVRLRTTFASADTSYGSVKLSCCEHYGNVLNEYSDPELRAILDVATRKKAYLRSDMISQYKEVQIHGPVCLSENVDCIVVNDRHMCDTSIKKLLDKFVEKNKCNLIWMEPDSTVSHPGSAGMTPYPAITSVVSESTLHAPYAPSYPGSAGLTMTPYPAVTSTASGSTLHAPYAPSYPGSAGLIMTPYPAVTSAASGSTLHAAYAPSYPGSAGLTMTPYPAVTSAATGSTLHTPYAPSYPGSAPYPAVTSAATGSTLHTPYAPSYPGSTGLIMTPYPAVTSAASGSTLHTAYAPSYPGSAPYPAVTSAATGSTLHAPYAPSYPGSAGLIMTPYPAVTSAASGSTLPAAYAPSYPGSAPYPAMTSAATGSTLHAPYAPSYPGSAGLIMTPYPAVTSAASGSTLHTPYARSYPGSTGLTCYPGSAGPTPYLAVTSESSGKYADDYSDDSYTDECSDDSSGDYTDEYSAYGDDGDYDNDYGDYY